MWAALFEIALIAASIGVPYFVDWFQTNKAKKENISQTDLLKITNSMLSAIQKSSNSKYNEAIRKLNSISLSSVGSGTFTDYLAKIRRRATQDVQKYERVVNDLSTDMNNIQNQITAFSMKSPGYVTSKGGKAEAGQIVSEAGRIASEYENRIGSPTTN